MGKSSVLIICDIDWSTGSIARDLKVLSDNWDITIMDWKIRPPNLWGLCNSYDVVFSFIPNSGLTWLELLTYGTVCCGVVDYAWMKEKGFSIVNPCVGAVSRELYNFLALDIARDKLFYIPATARCGRFKRNSVEKFARVLGWVGNPITVEKRFWMFEEIVAATGLQANVSYLNYDYNTVGEFYRGVDILVCTSATEGGPLGVFEAIACGVPVISTPVGVTLEMPQIWKFKTIDEAEKLISRLRDFDIRKKYCDEQYNALESTFSMEKLYPYWELFFKACKEKRYANL